VDDEVSPWVIVITQALGRRYFPHEDPIGKRDPRPRSLRAQYEHPGDSAARDRWSRRRCAPIRLRLKRASHDVRFRTISMDRNILEDFTTFHTGRVLPCGPPLILTWWLPCKKWSEIEIDQALFEVHTMEEALADRVGFPRFRKWRLFGKYSEAWPCTGARGIYGVMSYVVPSALTKLGCEWLWARDAAMFWDGPRPGHQNDSYRFGRRHSRIASADAPHRRFLFGVKSTDPVTYSIVALS